VTSDHEDTKNIGLKKMLNIAEKIEYVNKLEIGMKHFSHGLD
jgi:hypothetical protein